MQTRYFIKKLAILVGSLYLIVTMTFVLMKVIPGDPFMQEQAIPQEIIESLHRHYGLDQPLLTQYGRYLKGIVTCDLGPSFKYEGRTVGEIIYEGFPVSCCLGLEAIFLAFSGGVLLGSIAAAKRGKYPDQLAMLIAVIGISVPNFILASFLQYIFAMKLNLLPVARWGSFAQTILPAIALAAIPMAFVARLTRTNMVEVL
ncbi:MAG: ABC transporter permease, partial [Chlamydiia bacterium]|nr:ABC transporter permease [Chlamydiia bacterium]